jgi:hypothetical protein
MMPRVVPPLLLIIAINAALIVVECWMRFA